MSIPGQIFIEIDPSLIPPGPAGASAYDVWIANGHTGTEADFLDWLRNGQLSAGVVKAIESASVSPGANTAQTVYVSTGLACTVSAQAGDKVLIDVRGMVNHTAQNIVHFTLKRDGIDLTPANHTGLGCARIDIADGVRALSLLHEDTVPQSGNITYELFWRCHNQGTAYLGRRPVDTAFMVPTTMTLTVR